VAIGVTAWNFRPLKAMVPLVLPMDPDMVKLAVVPLALLTFAAALSSTFLADCPKVSVHISKRVRTDAVLFMLCMCFFIF
jgi:hypothetical protein